jgi:triosephosphate isomerase
MKLWFFFSVSPEMVKEAGCAWVILGHSERRTLFHEDDDVRQSRIEYDFI